MAVTQKLVTSNFNVWNAKQFVDSFTKGTDYFMFAGKHIPYPNIDDVITVPDNSDYSKNTDIYNNMVFAKRIKTTDVAHVIPNNAWAANTYYDQYEHDDATLLTKQFYTVVNDTTEYNVYKCLFNNNSNTSTVFPSTIAPSRSGSVLDLNPIITGDGYAWKYMYTITKANYDKFATSTYVPITPNTAVIAAAIPGTIEVIKIVDGGKGYNNYIANGTFITGDINISGVDTLYGAPDTAEAIDDYYQGCVIKITSGTGVGQYLRIVNYTGVGSKKTFVFDKPFAVEPSVGDTYEVYPYLYLWGDGAESILAEAIAIINPAAANSISHIEMLAVGENYRYAVAYPNQMPSTLPISIGSVYIQVPQVIQQDPKFKSSNLKPIISPALGHGGDPLNELGGNRVGVSIKYTNSESGTIPVQNDYRQLGIIKNPKYTNVDLILTSANTIGGFSINETVYQFKQLKLSGNVNITLTSNSIIKTDFGKISNTVTILNAGIAYNSSVDIIVANNAGTNGTGFAATFSNSGSGAITSILVSNTGINYTTAPTLSITTSTGSNAQLLTAIANPQTPIFKDSFAVGDYVLVSNGTANFMPTVSNVPQDYQITASSNATFTANNASVSALVLQASGTVTSISVGQITLTNVAGIFTEGSKIVGIQSAATGVIQTSNSSLTAIQVNDKSATSFVAATQLTRLVGDFTSGSTPFLEDEIVTQNSLISYAKPSGYLHHADIQAGANNDTLHISNKFGIYNLDPAGVRSIIGSTSGTSLNYLTNKYPGDFVVGSGEVIYYENVGAITRSDNKSEIIKIILEF